MAVALLALFVALSGTGYAAVKINGKDIKKGTVTGKALKKNTLTGTQINEAKLAKVPSAITADSAGNAATLAGLAPSGFAKGDVNVITHNATIPDTTNGTIIEIPGLFRLVGGCSSGNHILLTTRALTDAVTITGATQFTNTSSLVTDGVHNTNGGSTFSAVISQNFHFEVWKASTPDVSYEVTGGTLGCTTTGVAIGHG